MKWATISGPAGPRLAIQNEDGVLIDAADWLASAGATPEDTAAASRGDMVTLIERWSIVGALLQTREVTSADSAPASLPSQPAWLPPVRPAKILCIALNNRAMDEDRITAPDHPAFFLKSPTSLIGHGQPIVIRPDYGLVHPEPELAVVIGARLKDADLREAELGIFGYTILNDVTSVGMRLEDHFHFRFAVPDKGVDNGFRVEEHHTTYAGRYKSADTFGPIGPVIVTADEVDDPTDLRIRCTVDGELVQDDRTSSYRYGPAEAISFISRYQTLLPGDVVSLGTAIDKNRAQRPLASVDLRQAPREVSVTIEGIGTLTSTITLEGDFSSQGDW